MAPDTFFRINYLGKGIHLGLNVLGFLFRPVCAVVPCQRIAVNCLKTHDRRIHSLLCANSSLLQNNAAVYKCYIRYWKKKHTGKSSEQIGDEEGYINEIEVPELQSVGGDLKDMNIMIPSLRLDAVLKSGLGLSRSTIEEAFYSSQIRINGKKALKKGVQVNLGDEIDVVRGPSPHSDKFVDVMRLIIVGIRIKDINSNFQLRLKRMNRLTIEAYNES